MPYGHNHNPSSASLSLLWFVNCIMWHIWLKMIRRLKRFPVLPKAITVGGDGCENVESYLLFLIFMSCLMMKVMWLITDVSLYVTVLVSLNESATNKVTETKTSTNLTQSLSKDKVAGLSPAWRHKSPLRPGRVGAAGCGNVSQQLWEFRLVDGSNNHLSPLFTSTHSSTHLSSITWACFFPQGSCSQNV